MIEKNIEKKHANRISYQMWYKRCFKGKSSRGSKTAKGGPYPLVDLDGGGGVQIRCDTGVMEKMQEVQAKQMDMMTKFMGAMIEILNEENLYEHRNTFWLRH